MRSFKWALIVAVVCAVPLTARAGFIVEGSLGTGLRFDPETDRTATNVMIAPGYGIGEMLRAELGFNFALGDVQGGQFDMELRPMLVIAPPVVPVYGRAIFAVAHLIDDADPIIAFGGAIGMSVSLGGIGLFGEVGLVPRLETRQTVFTLEGRLGVYYAF